MTIYQKEFSPLNSNIMANRVSGLLLSNFAKQKINRLHTGTTYGSYKRNEEIVTNAIKVSKANRKEIL